MVGYDQSILYSVKKIPPAAAGVPVQAEKYKGTLCLGAAPPRGPAGRSKMTEIPRHGIVCASDGSLRSYYGWPDVYKRQVYPLNLPFVKPPLSRQFAKTKRAAGSQRLLVRLVIRAAAHHKVGLVVVGVDVANHDLTLAGSGMDEFASADVDRCV